jgi:hypothetical protein
VEDLHAPWRPLDINTLTRQRIQTLALLLEGGKHRWDLLDAALKASQSCLNLGSR